MEGFLKNSADETVVFFNPGGQFKLIHKKSQRKIGILLGDPCRNSKKNHWKKNQGKSFEPFLKESRKEFLKQFQQEFLNYFFLFSVTTLSYTDFQDIYLKFT